MAISFIRGYGPPPGEGGVDYGGFGAAPRCSATLNGVRYSTDCKYMPMAAAQYAAWHGLSGRDRKAMMRPTQRLDGFGIADTVTFDPTASSGGPDVSSSVPPVVSQALTDQSLQPRVITGAMGLPIGIAEAVQRSIAEKLQTPGSTGIIGRNVTHPLEYQKAVASMAQSAPGVVPNPLAKLAASLGPAMMAVTAVGGLGLLWLLTKGSKGSKRRTRR